MVRCASSISQINIGDGLEIVRTEFNVCLEWDELGWAESCEKPEQTNNRMNKYIGCAFRWCCSQSRASCSDGYSFSFLFFSIGFNVIFYIYKNNTNSNILLYLSANSRVREHWVRSDCQINWVSFFFILSSSCVGSSIKTNRFTALLL